MSVFFEQLKVPKKHPDALCAVGRCTCGFDIYGDTVDSVKSVFHHDHGDQCPLCHQPVGE